MQHMRPSGLAALSSPKFHRAVIKYGVESFRLEYLLTGLTGEAAIRDEILAIYLLEPEYNLTAGGEGCLGRTPTEATRAKIASSLAGHEVTAATREKIGATSRGRPVSQETREKLSRRNKGSKRPASVGEKISAAKTNPPKSTRDKLSALNKGRKHTDRSRANMSAGCTTKLPKSVWAEAARLINEEGYTLKSAAEAAGCSPMTAWRAANKYLKGELK